VEPHLLPAAVDPAPEAAPLAHERLVRHLDRRRAAARVAVEREEAPSAELLDRLGQGVLVDLHRRKLRPLDAPPRVLGALAERHEPEEQLTGRLLLLLPEAAVDLLRPAGEGAGDAADRAVGVTREGAPFAPLVELGQRVLEQRQRARLVGHVRHELREQTRLEPRADSLGRAGDGALELLRPQRDERLDVVAQQLCEAAVEQRPVVEVGPKGDDDAQPCVRVVDRPLEQREELRASRLLLDEREHLLELVDDEHELGLVVREETLDRAQQSAFVLLELLEQTTGDLVADTQERRLELLERIGAGEHLGDVPALGARERAGSQPRHEPRPHDGRLAAAARADDGEEARLRQALDEVLGQRLPAEEVLGVVFGEGAQPLVRVARLERARDGGIERTPEGELARGVLALGPDCDHLDRLLETFQPHRSPLDVVEPVDLAREVRDARAHEHLARARERAEACREVESAAAIATVDAHRLPRVEADPDRERQARIRDRLLDESLLQVGCSPQRLACRVEHGERLVAAELDEGAASRLDRLARELGKARREARSSLVAALLGEPRVAADVSDEECLDPGFDGRHRRIVRYSAS